MHQLVLRMFGVKIKHFLKCDKIQKLFYVYWYGHFSATSAMQCLSTEKVSLSTKKVPQSTEKVPQYCSTGTSDLVGSRRLHRHPYCRGSKLKKSKKRKIRIFEKPDFPDPGPDQVVPVHPGSTLRSQGVRRSQKKRKKNFRKNRISRIRMNRIRTESSGSDGGAEGYLQPKFQTSSCSRS